MKTTILILALFLGTTLVDSQGRDTTVAKADYLKLLAARHNELSKIIEDARGEQLRIEGQMNILQAMKQDSIRVER